MTPHERPGTIKEIPVVVGIALDRAWRDRLATLFDGAAVVMFAQDANTAHSLLGGQLGGQQPAPSRPGAGVGPVVRTGGLEIDRLRCRARWRDTPLVLTHRERDLLACLAAKPARVWTYQELYAAAWPGRYLDAGPVRAAVKRVRQKLAGAGVPVRVDAVRGVGYQLVEARG